MKKASWVLNKVGSHGLARVQIGEVASTGKKAPHGKISTPRPTGKMPGMGGQAKNPANQLSNMQGAGVPSVPSAAPPSIPTVKQAGYSMFEPKLRQRKTAGMFEPKEPIGYVELPVYQNGKRTSETVKIPVKNQREIGFHLQNEPNGRFIKTALWFDPERPVQREVNQMSPQEYADYLERMKRQRNHAMLTSVAINGALAPFTGISSAAAGAGAMLGVDYLMHRPLRQRKEASDSHEYYMRNRARRLAYAREYRLRNKHKIALARRRRQARLQSGAARQGTRIRTGNSYITYGGF